MFCWLAAAPKLWKSTGVSSGTHWGISSVAGKTFLVLNAEHIPVPADCSRFVWGLRPDLDQRPGRGEEEEWGEPVWSGAGASGGPGHTQWHSSPQLHSGCQVEKWIWGCQSIYFSRDSRNRCFCAISLFRNAGDYCRHFHSTCGWAVISRPPRHSLCPGALQTGASRASLVPPGLACEPCPYVATLSLLYPYILSRSAPSHVWRSHNYPSCLNTCWTSLHCHRTVWFTITFIAWP